MAQKSAGPPWWRLVLLFGVLITRIFLLQVDRRKFEEMAELDKKRYVEEAVNRMEGWQS